MSVTLHTSLGDIKIEIYVEMVHTAASNFLALCARGIVSMANKGPNTNRSQFFITYGPQPHLNNVNTVVGRVIDGFETLDAMERTPVGKKDRPTTDIVLESVTIHANPIADGEAS